MTKYRLKKDTPEFKAGEVFEMIHDVDVGDVLTQNAFRQDMHAFEVDLIDNFDEWFEVVDEPKYLRRLIKELKFGGKNGVEIVFRFIKDWYYYYYDEVMSNSTFNGYNEGTVERLGLGKEDEVFDIDIAIKGLNQMVDDGYIEIEDNPNIVWEDNNE